MTCPDGALGFHRLIGAVADVPVGLLNHPPGSITETVIDYELGAAIIALIGYVGGDWEQLPGVPVDG